VTTNYDDFMVQALTREGKTPYTAICRWWGKLSPDAPRAADSDYDPSPAQPIVYHLHGSSQEDMSSLVLAEVDYLEFLLNLTVDYGKDGRIFLPTPVLDALTKPLLFIGYSLQDWTFRAIFHGLLRTIADVRRRRHVSVQLLPPLHTSTEALNRAELYLNRYFNEWKVSVYWGTAQAFCTELRGRLE
jgi:hypothetical protein